MAVYTRDAITNKKMKREGQKTLKETFITTFDNNRKVKSNAGKKGK